LETGFEIATLAALPSEKTDVLPYFPSGKSDVGSSQASLTISFPSRKQELLYQKN
jgi:hypothetical protein